MSEGPPVVPPLLPPDLPPAKALAIPSMRRGDGAELADLLEDTLRAAGFGDLVYDSGHLHGYLPSHGVYVPIDDPYLIRVTAGYAGTRIHDDDNPRSKAKLHVSTGKARDAISMLQAKCSRPHFFDAEAPGVAFSDTYVIVTPHRLRFEPLSSSHRARFAYPFPFPQSAETPAYDAFLGRAFTGDADAEDKVRALDQFQGAVVAGVASTFERALINYGLGLSGKSQEQQITEGLMPFGAVTHLPPQLWGDQYSRGMLAGARLNSCGELPEQDLDRTSIAKMVISGEAQQERVPGRQATTFRPRCGHTFNVNEGRLPAVTDRTEGFRRRWILVTWNHPVDGAVDVYIAKRILAAERPQIVRRVLEAAVDLLAQGGYTLPASHHVVLSEWLQHKRPLQLFLETKTRPSTAASESTGARSLYRAYCAWLTSNGATSLPTETAFGREAGVLLRKRTGGPHGNTYAVVLLDPEGPLDEG